jgi:hypothetical protein
MVHTFQRTAARRRVLWATGRARAHASRGEAEPARRARNAAQWATVWMEYLRRHSQ